MRSASRSAVPRWTGNPPSDVNNQADHRNFHMLSLPMNRMRRRVTQPMSGVSMLERWTGARTKGPSVGMLERPETRVRQKR
jgi:hypothetical protein